HGRHITEGEQAELFRVQISARARLPHGPGQSGPGRQIDPQPNGLCKVVGHSRAGRYGRHFPRFRTRPASRRGGPEAATKAAGYLDAAHDTKRGSRTARRGSRTESRHEPLSENRIRASLIRNFMDGRELTNPVLAARPKPGHRSPAHES